MLASTVVALLRERTYPSVETFALCCGFLPLCLLKTRAGLSYQLDRKGTALLPEQPLGLDEEGEGADLVEHGNEGDDACVHGFDNIRLGQLRPPDGGQGTRFGQ